jgi:hypothetical protein
MSSSNIDQIYVEFFLPYIDGTVKNANSYFGVFLKLDKLINTDPRDLLTVKYLQNKTANMFNDSTKNEINSKDYAVVGLDVTWSPSIIDKNYLVPIVLGTKNKIIINIYKTKPNEDIEERNINGQYPNALWFDEVSYELSEEYFSPIEMSTTRITFAKVNNINIDNLVLSLCQIPKEEIIKEKPKIIKNSGGQFLFFNIL